ncbi:hypothetical protein E0Z10_g6583 [Xylaria hypoxylon]|uniref:F-box domain-containing protein n=1 Tax=Xylaria hypoxylon TaxID=37992 RepID=A0A4Z0YSX7_9PEZI|nr:hypothetical protein E0Z10_g6583 [Xylaria hypoxylon]
MSYSTRFTRVHELIFGSDGLTQEEIRHLKILLSSVGTDLIGELPLEITVLVALYLPLEDFARCLRVSKVWRERLLSNPVMAAYAGHRWPALVNGAVNRCDFQGTLSKLGSVTKFNYHIRDPFDVLDYEFIEWAATAEHQFDLIFPDNPPDAYTQYEPSVNDDHSDAIFGFGKAAQRLCGCVVVVDDLRSRTRKVFTPPSGTMHGVLKLQEIGSRLLIGAIDRLLIAWDHVNNQAYEKLLPCRSLHYATQDNRVAVVLYGGDIVIWTPGNAALHINKPLLTLEPSLDHSKSTTWEACLNVFFDRRNDKTFFLASGYFFNVGSRRMVRVTVHEFSVACHIASWSYDEEDLWEDRYNEHVPEPRIVMLEYEFDYSSIFFGRRHEYENIWPFAKFDKLERRFVIYETDLLDSHYSERSFINEDCAFIAVITSFFDKFERRTHGMIKKGIDLDFLVDFIYNNCYRAVRFNSPYQQPDFDPRYPIPTKKR